jgi:prepilin-type N-terminal cleavage/methylation domain-containing protein
MTVTHPGRRGRGFSLLEVLVALVLLGVALLLGGALIGQQRAALERLDAHRDALRAMEATLEALRSGSRPLTSSVESWPSTSAQNLRLTVETVCIEPPQGLWRVRVEARYEAAGDVHERKVETRLFRPVSCRGVV